MTSLRFQLQVLSTLLLAFPAAMYGKPGQTTVDSLVDVFPLSAGNEWTYRYFVDSGIWPGGNPGVETTDSGQVAYHVQGGISSLDSTVWQLRVIRRLVRHQISWVQPQDTSFPISDTSLVDLVENKHGQHQVYMLSDPQKIRFDVFPFTSGFVDTTPVVRYRQVGPGDTVEFQSWIQPPAGPAFRSNFTFKKNIGLIRNIFNDGAVDAWSTNNHFLLSSTITSLAEQHNVFPPSFSLFQNFPNPFNPSTTIRYSIPERAFVTLTVVTVLGEQVATLANEMQTAGYHEVRFNASGLASGVYFYRLSAGGYLSSKRLLLLR
jgi:hypothetical protein